MQERNIRRLYLDTASGGLISGGINTFLPVFLVRLGAPNMLVSLLTSLPAILMALWIMPAGLFAERQRDLVRVTVWSRIPHRLSFLLLALAPFLVRDHLAEVVVVLWTLKSIPGAFIRPAWMGVMAEMIPPHLRPRVHGNRWALVSLISVLAVPAFGYLLEGVAFPINYQIVFFISFLSAAISLTVFRGIKIPPSEEAAPEEGDAGGDAEVTQAPPGHGPAQAKGLIGQLRDQFNCFVEAPAFLRYLAMTFVLRIGLHMPAALYSIYWIRYLDASDSLIGWRTMAANVALIVGYLVWGRIATRRGHHLVLMACTIGTGLYPALTGLLSNSIWLPLVALPYGFFSTGISIAFLDTMMGACPTNRRPSFVALYFLCAQVALFVAPPAGSLLADWLGIRGAFFVASGIHVVAAVLFRVFHIGREEAGDPKGSRANL